MKTWIFTLSLELVYPLLLQGLVPIGKNDPTVPIPILIVLSLPPRRLPPRRLPPRRLVESSFSLRQRRENTQRTGKTSSSGLCMMKISMVLFAEFVNRPQQRAPHITQKVFGSQTIPELEESY